MLGTHFTAGWSSGPAPCFNIVKPMTKACVKHQSSSPQPPSPSPMAMVLPWIFYISLIQIWWILDLNSLMDMDLTMLAGRLFQSSVTLMLTEFSSYSLLRSDCAVLRPHSITWPLASEWTLSYATPQCVGIKPRTCECRDLKQISGELVGWKDPMNPSGSWDPSPNQQARYFFQISARTLFLVRVREILPPTNTPDISFRYLHEHCFWVYLIMLIAFIVFRLNSGLHF